MTDEATENFYVRMEKNAANRRIAKTRTKVTIKVTLERDWEVIANMLGLLTGIRELAGVEDVDLDTIHVQEELL